MAYSAFREFLAGLMGTQTPAQQDVASRRSVADRVKAETDVGSYRMLTDPAYRDKVAAKIKAMSTPTPTPAATPTPQPTPSPTEVRQGYYQNAKSAAEAHKRQIQDWARTSGLEDLDLY